MADIISFKFLPLTLNIETMGGVCTPIIKRGTPLPTKRTKQFSTASDNQPAISIKVYLGESPLQTGNIFIGQCELLELPAAKQGEIPINVSFEVDEQCGITIKAEEDKTHKNITSVFESPSAHLTKDKLEELISKNKASQLEDEVIADHIETKNKAMKMLKQAEQYVKEVSIFYPANTNNLIEEAIAELGISIESDDYKSIKDMIRRLEQLLPSSKLGTFDDIFRGDIFNGFQNIFGTSTKKQRENNPSQSTPKNADKKAQTSVKSQVIEELTRSEKVSRA